MIMFDSYNLRIIFKSLNVDCMIWLLLI